MFTIKLLEKISEKLEIQNSEFRNQVIKILNNKDYSDKQQNKPNLEFIKQRIYNIKDFLEKLDKNVQEKIIESFNETDRCVIETIQEILSPYFRNSLKESEEKLLLPEIKNNKTVKPEHSAFIVPVYIGNRYIDDENNPFLETLCFDHPYPLEGDVSGILPENEMLFLQSIRNFDTVLNSKYEDLPENFKYPVFVIVGTTSPEISEQASEWMKKLIKEKTDLKNIDIKIIDNTFFKKVFDEFIIPELENLEKPVAEYIKKIYDKGLCSYPNIRNFSELFAAAFLTSKYPSELTASVEVDEDQLIETGYAEILKQMKTSFLGLGLNGLGSEFVNGKILGLQAGEYYKYNPELDINESIKISDVGDGDYKIDTGLFYQKNYLYKKAVDNIYSFKEKKFRHPAARGGLIFTLCNTLFETCGFCYDDMTRGEDTARLITVYGEGHEEMRYVPMLKMAHNQSPYLKKLMKATGNDVTSVYKTFISDLKRWKLKSQLVEYYIKQKNENVQDCFFPYPGGMFDNIDFRIDMTILLELLKMNDENSMNKLIAGWREVYEYAEKSDVKNNYPLFIQSMRYISGQINPKFNLLSKKFFMENFVNEK